MKRKYFLALTLFTVLSLTHTFQFYAEPTEYTLDEAKDLLNNKIAVLDSYNTVLADAKSTMKDEEKAWIANEEDITENRIDSVTVDPWGVGSAVLKQIIDFEDRAKIATTLGAAIGAVETAKTDADNAQNERDTIWDIYVELANEAEIPANKRLSKGADALPVSYPDVRIDCPGCNLRWEGSGISHVAGHIIYCSVKGHKNQSNELVNKPLPHFLCQSCPLSHQHYSFVCRGGCGEMFPEPATIIAPGGGYSMAHITYYDHWYTCKEDVSGPFPCSDTAFTCKTPQCPNNANHLIYGDCKKHKIKKGDAAAPAAHAKLASPVYCSVTHNFGGMSYTCIITRWYKCDPVSHTYHDFYHGHGLYPPGVSSPSENGGCDTDGNGNGNNGNGNGNGAPPPSGGSGNQGNGNNGNGNGNGNNGDGNGNGAPNPNGGCTPPCINSHCISDTAHTIYTCIREIKDRQDAFGNWIYVPCGEQFTKCQDSAFLMRRGTCSRLSERRTANLSSGNRYHSDIYP